jgi:hypothetical protein
MKRMPADSSSKSSALIRDLFPNTSVEITLGMCDILWSRKEGGNATRE